MAGAAARAATRADETTDDAKTVVRFMRRLLCEIRPWGRGGGHHNSGARSGGRRTPMYHGDDGGSPFAGGSARAAHRGRVRARREGEASAGGWWPVRDVGRGWRRCGGERQRGEPVISR